MQHIFSQWVLTSLSKATKHPSSETKQWESLNSKNFSGGENFWKKKKKKSVLLSSVTKHVRPEDRERLNCHASPFLTCFVSPSQNLENDLHWQVSNDNLKKSWWQGRKTRHRQEAGSFEHSFRGPGLFLIHYQSFRSN